MPSKIIIQRKSEFLNKMPAVQILIDGVQAGTIANGKGEEFVVEPGTHKVQTGVSWYKSREMDVTLNEGETKFLKVRMGMQYFGITYIILLIAILSDVVPRLAGVPKPDWWPVVKVIIIVPVALYYLYYLSIGRKNYVVLEEDKDNIFN